jgi:ATP-binding cassette subfamily G (WHITE) protein 2 (PDR)
MQPYFDQAPGYLQNPGDTQSCGFCSFGNSNVFLSAVGISYDDVWRNFGLLWVYILLKIAGAVFFFLACESAEEQEVGQRWRAR